jgi:S-adenosylmethionine hydrolase
MRLVIPYILSLIVLTILSCQTGKKHAAAVVLQTDFGVKDGAVAAMKGVATAVDDQLAVYDLTHEIPAFDIWEAAYRLHQVVPYWPAGTVFVSVVDPGVGTNRRSVVAKTKSGHFIVTPDNGTLTLLADAIGIAELRQIDEKMNRRAGSDSSYTFHGRDVYAYVAARLAAGKISFEGVGPLLSEPVVKISYQPAELTDSLIKGTIPALDIQYGNIWTNIPDSLLRRAGYKMNDSIAVQILYKDSLKYAGKMPLVQTFGAVPEGQPLCYFNSLMNWSVAINMGNFAQTHQISHGPDWRVQILRY